MCSFRAALFVVVYGLLVSTLTAAQGGQTSETRTNALTNKDVIEMLRARLPQEVVIAKIKSSPCNLDTSPIALKELKAAHVPKKVIVAMIQAPAVASPSCAHVAANTPANTGSDRIQNIPPEEMWKRVSQCVFPTYPALAFSSGIGGTVDIGLGISPKGEVANHRVLSGHPLLVPSAVEAVNQWKFQPNVVEGTATWSRVRALARFNADGTTTIDLAPARLADDFGDPGTPPKGSAQAMISTDAAIPKPAAKLECKSEQPWTGVQARDIESSETSLGFYQNNYFGLTFHFPVEWQVANRATLEEIATRQRMAMQKTASQPNVKISFLPSYQLFFARTDGPIGSLGPTVKIWAEKWPFIRRSDQYFPNVNFLNDKTADGTRGPVEMEINGTKYFRADRWGKVDDRGVYDVRLVTYARD